MEGRLGLEIRDSDQMMFYGLPYWMMIVGLIVCVLLRPKLLGLAATHLPGHCVKCGYDLRGTPERCPECGLIVGVTIRAKSRV
jgi:hypothetical protein